MKAVLKSIYRYAPLKREVFSLLKLFWSPSKSVYKHLYFNGVFRVQFGKNTFKINHYGYQIENEVFWAGLTNGWEKESVKIWIQLCRKADVIVDIGANTGIYSLIAKSVNPASKVYAFEPVKRVFHKLQQNIDLNQYDIHAEEKAVSNADGKAIIYDTYSDHVYSVTVNKNLSSSETKVIETEICTVTLNTFMRENSLSKIDLIKIDVETHEPEVLEGFSDYLFSSKPTMLIEILSDEIGEKVSKLIEGLGYLFFNIDEKGRPRHVERITKSDYFNYLLCSPAVADELGLLKKS